MTHSVMNCTTLVVLYVCMLCVQPGIEACVVYLMSIISLSHSIHTENHNLKIRSYNMYCGVEL